MNSIGDFGWGKTSPESFYSSRSYKPTTPERKTWKSYSPRWTNIHSFPKYQSPKKKSLLEIPNFRDKKQNSPMTDIMENLKNLIDSPVMGYQKLPAVDFSRTPGSRRTFMPILSNASLSRHHSPVKKQMASFSLTPNKAKLNPMQLGNFRDHHDAYNPPEGTDVSYGQPKEKLKPFCAPPRPPLKWTGELPPKDANDNKYSRKVFLGGVPWDIKDENLKETFEVFGSLAVEWPPNKNGQKPKGYVYIVFDDATSVTNLLEFCRSYSARVFRDVSDGTMYKYHVRSEKMHSKEIQVIPWNLNDDTKVIGTKDKVNMHHQVFVGGLHGMLTATGLSKVMNDLFGNVAYVEIDTDKYKYPLGSGRVNFSSLESYQRAIQEKYVQVQCISPKVDKRIQIDPYIRENENCSKCQYPGPIYCRKCLDYFCEDCWDWHMRNSSTKHERVCRTRNGKIV